MNYVIVQFQYVFGIIQVVVMTHVAEKRIGIQRTVFSVLNFSKFQQLTLHFSVQMCVVSLRIHLSNITEVKAAVLNPQSKESHVFSFCLPWNHRQHKFPNYTRGI